MHMYVLCIGCSVSYSAVSYVARSLLEIRFVFNRHVCIHITLYNVSFEQHFPYTLYVNNYPSKNEYMIIFSSYNNHT